MRPNDVGNPETGLYHRLVVIKCASDVEFVTLIWKGWLEHAVLIGDLVFCADSRRQPSRSLYDAALPGKVGKVARPKVLHRHSLIESKLPDVARHLFHTDDLWRVLWNCSRLEKTNIKRKLPPTPNVARISLNVRPIKKFKVTN